MLLLKLLQLVKVSFHRREPIRLLPSPSRRSIAQVNVTDKDGHYSFVDGHVLTHRFPFLAVRMSDRSWISAFEDFRSLIVVESGTGTESEPVSKSLLLEDASS